MIICILSCLNSLVCVVVDMDRTDHIADRPATEEIIRGMDRCLVSGVSFLHHESDDARDGRAL